MTCFCFWKRQKSVITRTTQQFIHPSVENVVAKLENDALVISEWFPNNRMKLNEDKCHLMIFGGKSNEVSVKIGEASVKESKEEKLLGIIFDQTLSFKQHVKTLCKKSQSKTSCPRQNILLHGHGKIEAGNASVCLISLWLLPPCLDVL